MTFERMWTELLPVGRSARSGGYFRQPFGSAEREAAAWFVGESLARGLVLETDPFGNMVAWWPDGTDLEDGSAVGTGTVPTSAVRRGAVLTGSHLDSVLDGGAFDGPLGVVSALAAFDLLRERGFVPRKRLGIAVFVEEEGSRFGVACLGSKLATGTTTWAEARGLRDPDGVALADVVGGEGRSQLLDGVECFVELHVEQGRDLVFRDAPVGTATAIWPHGRYAFEFTGEANHAGATRMEDRKDPAVAWAATVLAAQQRALTVGQRATFGRVEVIPNATNAVPSSVRAWLDARADSEVALAELVAGIRTDAEANSRAHGTRVRFSVDSVTPEVRFDAALTGRLAESVGAGAWPSLPTAAGHDAGVLSTAGIPTAMLFVRNPTGVSHSPEESAEIADCLSGVTALADVLAEVAA